MTWKIGLEALRAALQQCLCHLNGSTAATTGSLQGTLPGNIAPILLHWHLHWNSGNHCKQCTICLYHSAYIYIYLYILHTVIIENIQELSENRSSIWNGLGRAEKSISNRR
jgi:hypothetical protein